jgi:type I restriction enzyme S subunit
MRRGDARHRQDPHFHRPRFRTLTNSIAKLGSVPLGEIVSCSDEVWDKSDGRFAHEFPYIEISAVGLGTNEYQIAQIPIGEAPSRARQVVRADDILVSLTRPHRGAIARVGMADDGVIASTGFAVLRKLLRDDVARDYLLLFLGSRFGLEQLLMRSSGGSYPAITSDELDRVLILVPKVQRQRELVAAMDAARAVRRAKLAEADALLTSLDRYLLDTLGLTPPPPDARRMFAIRRDDADSRLDADFHSPRFQAIRKAIETCPHPARSVAEICERIATGFAAGQQDQAFDEESGVPHLRPLNLNIYGELSITTTKRVPRNTVPAEDWCERGEVLFNNTNSTEMVGKSTVFDLSIPCACSNHMTRLKLRDGMNAEFVADLFNALRSLGYLGLLSTNFNNQAGINLDTLRALRLPVPNAAAQTTIAAEVRRRRETARRLRAEAESGWAEAKRWFEDQLLGKA